MTELRALQRRVAAARAERGFTTDPLRVFLLLTEEVGEVAGELKRTWSRNYPAFDKGDLADEVADCLVLLLALADSVGIDVASAVESKFFGRDRKRNWATAGGEATDSAPSPTPPPGDPT
ncbi:MAG: MazG nucleotide pyrophosphohydrolase domain-containing protein [Candidatus Latescibacterota bacterium]